MRQLRKGVQEVHRSRFAKSGLSVLSAITLAGTLSLGASDVAHALGPWNSEDLGKV